MKILTNAYINSKVIYPEVSISTSAYGVEHNINDSSPVCTRIGNMEAHRTLPIQSKYYGCIYNLETKQEVYKLNPNDWSLKEDGTPAVLDGTDGAIKVHIPEFYGRVETEGDIQRIWTVEEVEDPTEWYHIREQYVDPWECNLQKSTQKVMCVVNSDDDWRGGYDHDDYAGKYDDSDNVFQNQHNKSITYKNLTEARTLARGCNQEVLCYSDYLWIFYWNYVIEYANLNCQAAFNPELTVEGYHQGGLGNGPTTFSNWAMFNNTQPIIPNGYENSIGNGTGVMSIPAQTFTYDSEGLTRMSSYNFLTNKVIKTNNPNYSVTITEILDNTSYFAYVSSQTALNTVVYHIEGLQSGQEIIFYESSINTPINVATVDGDITVNWTTSTRTRSIASNFIGPCNITMSIVSAEPYYGFQGTTASMSTCRWRGLSNPFGHIWRILEGVIIRSYQEDGEWLHRKIYVTNDPAKYGNKDQMELVSENLVNREGYVKFAELHNNAFVPTEVGGRSIRYFSDYWYVPSSYTENDYILVSGGDADDGGGAGLSYFYSYWSASSRGVNGGFRTTSLIQNT